ncbi:MAG: hypothetical protein CM15mP128_3820 [Methanobacteriota archaeon]|nr:MAG: hypothetical protein CM15mP128_3820 [Euryarchaeota archaeon]
MPAIAVSVDVDDSPLLSVHLVGFGANGTATLHASISDAEGSVVWSAMDNVTLGDGDATVLVLNLSTVPAGVQQLELVLSGHVMVSTPRTSRRPRFTLQRDRPCLSGWSRPVQTVLRASTLLAPQPALILVTAIVWRGSSRSGTTEMWLGMEPCGPPLFRGRCRKSSTHRSASTP